MEISITFDLYQDLYPRMVFNDYSVQYKTVIPLHRPDFNCH